MRDYGVDGQIGLEPTPGEFLDKMVRVFREVKRVLRSDGTCWVNMGDSYANDTKWGGSTGGKHALALHGDSGIGRRKTMTGLKAKDLCGMPWRLALALQDDGWYLRSDIIWFKPNPMPSSVKDRPTTSHEYIFMLAKSERYFYDAIAIAEPAVSDHSSGNGFKGRQGGSLQFPMSGGEGTAEQWMPGGTRNKRTVWEIATESFSEAHFATYPTKLVEPCIKAGTSEKGCCANCGSPWERVVESTTESMSGSGKDGNLPVGKLAGGSQVREGHDIRSGPVTSSVTTGWQPTCHCDLLTEFKPGDFDEIKSPTGEGAGEDPSLEVGRAGMERPRGENEGSRVITRFQQRAYAAQLRSSPHRAAMREEVGYTTFAHYLRSDKTGSRPIPEGLLGRWIELGWTTRVEMPVRTPYPVVPATVLDPFSGAGTTAMVASRLGRDAVGIELSPEYAEISLRRISGDSPMFNHVELA